MFVDEVIIKLIAGKGGDGCTSFRREKFIPLGGPNGGNGGKGADIIFQVEKGLKTLVDLKYKKQIKGDKGVNGKGSNMHGAKAEDVIVKVPEGTTLIDEETGLVICDSNSAVISSTSLPPFSSNVIVYVLILIFAYTVISAFVVSDISVTCVPSSNVGVENHPSKV